MPLTKEHCAACYKVLILGDTGVGKTAILDSLTGKEYKENMPPTVGVDFVTKIVESDGALVCLRVWDMAGQRRFHSFNRQHYDKTQGVVLVYDITNRDTYTQLLSWIDCIESEIHLSHSKVEPIPIVLCGHKADLEDQRQVSREEGQKLLDDSKVFEFFETSAKTGDNIFTAFHRLAYHITDICDPHLMKSYHPFMIKEPDTDQTQRRQTPASKGKKAKKKASKPKKGKDKSAPKNGKDSSAFMNGKDNPFMNGKDNVPSKRGKNGATKKSSWRCLLCCGSRRSST